MTDEFIVNDQVFNDAIHAIFKHAAAADGGEGVCRSCGATASRQEVRRSSDPETSDPRGPERP
jgi:hypothetical protein